ncbi:MAG: hypothetical protein NC337_13350 [Roseburia sp.]|nr:hypothetical protein [Roseburia sp.]
MQERQPKYTIKDSVFADLFKSKKYLMQLYRTLHPEDETATEDELTDITIKNVLTDGIYNDLGFLLGERFLLLLEAQSLWTTNIIVRALLYLAQTYHDYFERTNQNLYRGRKVKMPKPELYVVYTGDRKNIPDTITLSEEFFGGTDTAVEVKVRVICENDTDSIINQYIIFCKVYNEQMSLHGRTRETVTETIRICKDRNVLKEYLMTREREVVSIMMSLFDEEEIIRSYIRSERYEAAQEAAREAAKEASQNKAKEKARLMLKTGKLSSDEIPLFFPELSDEEVRELEAEVLRLI